MSLLTLTDIIHLPVNKLKKRSLTHCGEQKRQGVTLICLTERFSEMNWCKGFGYLL